MRLFPMIFCAVLSAGVSSLSAKNLLREDMFVRIGFDTGWTKGWPEQQKDIAAWRHVPSSAGDNRPVKMATLGAPFMAPGIYTWPTKKIHEYTAVTRFFLTPDEKKALHSWGVRLGSIGDNWQVFLNGNLVSSAWHVDAKGEKINVHRVVRDTVIELPATLPGSGRKYSGVSPRGRQRIFRSRLFYGATVRGR